MDDEWWEWCVREPDSDFDPQLKYANHPDLFSLKIFHGGDLTEFPDVTYEGKSDYIDKIDPDRFSVIILNDMLVTLGYSEEDVVVYHFKVPGETLDFGLRPLGNDNDVLSLIKYAKTNKVIEVYVQHAEKYDVKKDESEHVHEAEFVDLVDEVVVSDRENGSDKFVHVSDRENGSESDDASYEQPITDDEHSESDDEGSKGKKKGKKKVDDEGSIGKKKGKEKVDDEGSIGKKKGKEKVDDEGSIGKKKGKENVDDEGSIGKKKGKNKVDEQDSDSDSDFLVDEDNIVQDYDVDMDEFRAAVDFDISDNEKNLNENENEDVEGMEEQVDLDGFDSLSDFDDDTTLRRACRIIKKNKKKVKGKKADEDPFYVSQTFSDRDEIKALVKSHAVQSRRQLFISKNDKSRFRVICLGGNISIGSWGGDDKMTNVGASEPKKKTVSRSKKDSGPTKSKGDSGVGEGISGKKKSNPKPRKKIPPPTCPWAIHISNLGGEGTWIVKTYHNEHTCLQTRAVKLCTVSWLAKQVLQKVRYNPGIPLTALQAELQQQHQVQVTINQVFRAKTMAIEKIQGHYQSQYALLRDYGEELLRSNPGSTVKIDVEPCYNPSSSTRQFRRMYICLGALKAGFKAGGRPILGLDGCFLKGPFPGQILTSVGVDPNNGIYPVAYALVEAETTQSWTWFLKLLGDDLDLDSNSYFTFISDRQKGIIPAISKVFPLAEHRFCLRHIHENMKPRWRGDVYKKLLWGCAAATTPQAFEKAMKAVKEKDQDLYDWLKEIPPKHWSRAFFSGRARCDVLLNNLCEVFNRQLIQGRDKPVITCLEFIREYLMKRIVVVHKLIARSNCPLTPAAEIAFATIKDEASQYTVIWNGGSKYQVSTHYNDHQDQRTVNLDERTCSCNKWELTGMPCRHAVACIWNKALHGQGDGIPERWVDKAYSIETWKRVYANTVDPINGQDMWPTSNCPTTLLPPKYHAQAGRPKKKRKKSAGEVLEASQASQKKIRKPKEGPSEVEVQKLSQSINPTGKLPRKGNSLTCNKCKKKGHNSRTCGRVAGSQGGAAGSQGGAAGSQGGAAGSQGGVAG